MTDKDKATSTTADLKVERDHPHKEPFQKPSNGHLPFSINTTCLITGEFLILLLTSLVVLPSLGFFAGVPIGPFTLIFCIMIALCGCLLLNRAHMLELGIASLIGVFLVVGCCLFCAQIFDLSWDANMYHKLIIHALGNGWIPNNGSVEPWQVQNEPFDPTAIVWSDQPSSSVHAEEGLGANSATWIDHYPKGVYCIGAALYCAFGNLEAGKAFTPIAMLGCMLVITALLNRRSFSAPQSMLIAVLAAINPITIAQLLIAYNDGFLMLAILVLLIGVVVYITARSREERILSLALIACGFTLCAQTKFTGFVYAGVFSLSFYICFLIRAVKGDAGTRFRSILTMSGFFAMVILSNFIVVGYATYMMNLFEHGNPFYPLFGEGAIDIMSKNEPREFGQMNNLEKLFFAIFGELSNPHINESTSGSVNLKVPFTITGKELDNLVANDLRISGFGVLYSGVLILQLLVIGLTIRSIFLNHRELFWAFICFAVPALLLLVGLSESWWARYSSYQYFFNIFALIFLFVFFRDHAGKKHILSGIAASIFSILLLVNTLLFFPYTIMKRVTNSEMIDIHIEYMKESTDDGRQILLNYYHELPGILYILSENGIDFAIANPDDSDIEYDWKIESLEYKVIDR